MQPCNVDMLYLNGMLLPSMSQYSSDSYTTSENIYLYMQKLERANSVDGVIVVIDSPGGSAVAGEEFSNAFASFKKPIAAVIKSSGVSAAYWASLGTDKIFASANSQIGSIGATFSYTDDSLKNEKEGITYNVISSGKFKDIGSSNKPLTEEEKKLLERDVKIVEQNFVEAVSKSRNLSKASVQEIADGSFMLGNMAKEKGLIDEIGGIEEARKYIESITGYANICQ